MAKPAVEFVAKGTKLLLVYRPRGDTVWVHQDCPQQAQDLRLVSTSTVDDVRCARFDQAGRGTVEGLPQRP